MNIHTNYSSKRITNQMSFPSECQLDFSETFQTNVTRLLICVGTLIAISVLLACIAIVHPIVSGYEHYRNRQRITRRPGNGYLIHGLFPNRQDPPV